MNKHQRLAGLGEAKYRARMYKDGRKWIVAGTTTMALALGLTFVSVDTPTIAQAATNEATTTAATQANAATSGTVTLSDSGSTANTADSAGSASDGTTADTGNSGSTSDGTVSDIDSTDGQANSGSTNNTESSSTAGQTPAVDNGTNNDTNAQSAPSSDGSDTSTGEADQATNQASADQLNSDADSLNTTDNSADQTDSQTGTDTADQQSETVTTTTQAKFIDLGRSDGAFKLTDPISSEPDAVYVYNEPSDFVINKTPQTGNIADGTFGTASWSISEDGTLHIGSGVLGDNTTTLTEWIDGTVNYGSSRTSEQGSPWSRYGDVIKTISVDGNVTLASDSSELFNVGKPLGNDSIVTQFTGLDQVDASQATNTSMMFANAGNVTSLTGLADWDVSNVTDFSAMFSNDKDLTDLDDISNWDVDNGQDFSNMLSGTGLSQIDLSKWNMSNATDISQMLSGNANLVSVNVADWDTSNVTDMSGVFSADFNLPTLDLSNWDTTKVIVPITNSSNDGRYDLIGNDDALTKLVVGPKMTLTFVLPYSKDYFLDGEDVKDFGWIGIGDGTEEQPNGTIFSTASKSGLLYSGLASDADTYLFTKLPPHDQLTDSKNYSISATIVDDHGNIVGTQTGGVAVVGNIDYEGGPSYEIASYQNTPVTITIPAGYELTDIKVFATQTAPRNTPAYSEITYTKDIATGAETFSGKDDLGTLATIVSDPETGGSILTATGINQLTGEPMTLGPLKSPTSISDQLAASVLAITADGTTYTLSIPATYNEDQLVWKTLPTGFVDDVTFNVKALPQTASVTYVDTATQQPVGDPITLNGVTGETGSYDAVAPAGYELAAGQTTPVAYTFTADNGTKLVIKIAKTTTTGPTDGGTTTPGDGTTTTPENGTTTTPGNGATTTTDTTPSNNGTTTDSQPDTATTTTPAKASDQTQPADSGQTTDNGDQLVTSQPGQATVVAGDTYQNLSTNGTTQMSQAVPTATDKQGTLTSATTQETAATSAKLPQTAEQSTEANQLAAFGLALASLLGLAGLLDRKRNKA